MSLLSKKLTKKITYIAGSLLVIALFVTWSSGNSWAEQQGLKNKKNKIVEKSLIYLCWHEYFVLTLKSCSALDLLSKSSICEIEAIRSFSSELKLDREQQKAISKIYRRYRRNLSYYKSKMGLIIADLSDNLSNEKFDINSVITEISELKDFCSKLQLLALTTVISFRQILTKKQRHILRTIPFPEKYIKKNQQILIVPCGE